jgi:hypothetical protein
VRAARDVGDDALEEGGVELLVDIAPVGTPTPTPTATPTPSGSPSVAPPIPDALGTTGVDPTAAIALGAALLFAGLLAVVSRAHRRRDDRP